MSPFRVAPARHGTQGMQGSGAIIREISMFILTERVDPDDVLQLKAEIKRLKEEKQLRLLRLQVRNSESLKFVTSILFRNQLKVSRRPRRHCAPNATRKPLNASGAERNAKNNFDVKKMRLE